MKPVIYKWSLKNILKLWQIAYKKREITIKFVYDDFYMIVKAVKLLEKHLKSVRRSK
jgi:hypothetical protein